MKTKAMHSATAALLTLGLCLMVLAAVPGEAAVTITAPLVGVGDGLNPDDPAWTTATQYTVALDTVISAAGVPTLLPSAKWKYLRVKALHNGTDIFFRLQWADMTLDDLVSDAPLFADGVALQIPYNAGYSSIAMGNQAPNLQNKTGAVNILFWRADMEDPLTPTRGHPQNIVAGGAGTVQTSPDSSGPPPLSPLASHSQRWLNNTWTVVFQRPLTGPPFDSQGLSPGNMVTLARGATYQITFAQWDGGNAERDGVKLVAGSWQTLRVQ